jgi:hypothetical protein
MRVPRSGKGDRRSLRYPTSTDPVLCHDGEAVGQIARVLKMTRKIALKWIDKTLPIDVKAALKDTPHRPRKRSSPTMLCGRCTTQARGRG